jgi:hypothetical protein
MKIRFLVSIADITGWSYDYGEIAEVTDEAAVRFIKNGHAEAVRDTADEAAVLAGAKVRKG